MRICAFEHCSNSAYQLQKWKIDECDVHKGVKHERCGCKPPFVLFPFPTNLSDAETRRDWIRAVNRKDPKTGKNWQPTFDSRVCSYHFVNGKTSGAHPSPSINLKREDAVNEVSSSHFVPKRKRSLPNKSRGIVPKKSKGSNEIIDVDGVIINTERDTKEISGPTNDSVAISTFNNNDHDYTLPASTMKCNCRKDCNCTGCSNKDLEIAYLKDKINKAYSIIRDVMNEDNIKAPKKNKM